MNESIKKLLMMGMLSILILKGNEYSDELSNAPDCDSPAVCTEYGYTLQFRSAYYRPSSEILRLVYPHAIVDWAIEGSKKLRHNNEVWAAVDWTSKHGCSLCFEERSQTRLSFVSISTGIKHLFDLRRCVQFYLGAGPCWTFMHIHDKYPYVQEHISENNLGALFKGGFRFTRSHFFLELFTDYFLQHISLTWCPDNNIEHRNATLNGIRVGGSIGFKF